MNARPYLIGAVVALLSLGALGLNSPLAEFRDKTVDCDATGDPEAITPATNAPNFGSLCVQNTSATCVHLGGSGVTTTTGIDVGDGCAAGKVFCADVRKMWCESASGTVTVDVVYGEQ